MPLEVHVHLLGHAHQVSLVLNQAHLVNLGSVKQHANDLGRVLGVLGMDMRVDLVTNLLLLLRSQRLGLLLRWLAWLTTHGWEVVAAHHWLLLLLSWTLVVELALSRHWVALVVASAALVVATALLALSHVAIVETLGRVQELLHLAPLLLLSLLLTLLGRLPELDLEQSRTEHVGLVKFLDGLLGVIHIGVENKVMNVSRVKFLTRSFL